MSLAQMVSSGKRASEDEVLRVATDLLSILKYLSGQGAQGLSTPPLCTTTCTAAVQCSAVQRGTALHRATQAADPGQGFRADKLHRHQRLQQLTPPCDCLLLSNQVHSTQACQHTLMRCAEPWLHMCQTLLLSAGLRPPVIHRDIKPENVVLEGGTWGGRVYLIDFGGVQGSSGIGRWCTCSQMHTLT